MAKKKAKSGGKELEDLAEWAGSQVLPDDVLDGDLRDACHDDSIKAFTEIKDAVMIDKLHFLWVRGWSVKRLR